MQGEGAAITVRAGGNQTHVSHQGPAGLKAGKRAAGNTREDDCSQRREQRDATER